MSLAGHGGSLVMTEQTQAERWGKRKTLVAAWEVWQVWAGAYMVCDFCSEEDADRIIADHEQAARVPVLEAALQKMVSWQTLASGRCRHCGIIGCIEGCDIQPMRAALAPQPPAGEQG